MRSSLSLRLNLIFVLTGAVMLSLATGPALAHTYLILAFGDSITQGFKRTADDVWYGILSPPNGVRTNDGYEPELEFDFSNQTNHTAYVYNWGCGGERTYQGVNRIDTVLASREADFILIMEGANDLYSNVSASTTKFNLGIMIDKSRAKQTEPIIATVTPNTAPNQPDGHEIPTSYNPAIQSLATEKGVSLADQYCALAENWSGYNSGDGLHVNDAGEAVLAQTWFNAIMDHGLPRPITIAPVLNLLIHND